MTIHLIESTIVLAVALLVSRLPRLRAATRHAIVFAALVKFAIPSALVTMLVDRFGARPQVFISGFVANADLLIANAAPPSIWPDVLRGAWLAIALALAMRAWLLARRMTRLALAEATPASARERALVTPPLRILRSPFTAAPAVIGVLRPTIVLPSSSDDLDDDELAAIVAHELAHISRRDNLLGIIETLLGCALWFHPLVWIARRDLARHREEASDDIALSGSDAPTYLGALAKIGRAAAIPHVAAVSCMGTGYLKERITHIMTSHSHRLLPHRLLTAFAIALIGAFTLAAGAARAQAAKDTKSLLYSVRARVRVVTNPAGFLVEPTITETATGREVPSNGAGITVRPGEEGVLRTSDNGTEIVARFNVGKDGSGICTLNATRAGDVIEHSTFSFAPPKPASTSQYHGEPISLNLENADFRDVIGTFSKLTGLKVVVDPNISAHVTINVTDMPWDEAFDHIVHDAGLQYQLSNNTVHIFK